MINLPEQPQGVFKLILESYKIWRQDWLQLLWLALVAAVVGIAPYFVLPALNTKHPDQYFAVIYQHAYFVVPYFILALFFLSAIIYQVHITMYNKHGTLLTAYRVALRRLPIVFLGFLLCSLLFAVGFSLFIVPGIVLTIMCAFVQPLIVIDDKGPIEAIHYSVRLVLGHWWRTFLTLTLGFAFFLVLIYAIELFAMDLWQVSHPSGQVWVSYNLFRVVLCAVYYPLFVSLLLALQADLEVRHAIDLDAGKE